MAWYYLDAQNTQNGPYEEEAFQGLIQNGTITEITLVYGPGLAEWVSLSQARTSGVLTLSAATSSSGLSLAPASGDLTTCPQCGAQVERSSLIPLEGRQVCPLCRNMVLQQIREGVGVTGPVNFDYATFGKRALAFLIDYVAMYVYGLLIQFLFLGGMMVSPDQVAMGVMVVYMICAYAGPLFYTLYFMGHEKYRGTPGMMALQIQIIRPDGARVGRWRILLRNMASGISALILGIGYLMMLWDNENRTLHDMMCDTRVVNK